MSRKHRNWLSVPRLTFGTSSNVKGQGHQATLGGCSSHHLQGRGHIVVVPLQATQLVNCCVPCPFLLTLNTNQSKNLIELHYSSEMDAHAGTGYGSELILTLFDSVTLTFDL